MQGSLPTFMDIGSSFSASEVLEDNLISQLQKHGKHMVRAVCCSTHAMLGECLDPWLL